MNQVQELQRKCILLTLAARMLLREMVDYKVQHVGLYPRDPEFDKLMSLIAVLPDEGEERDWVSDINELKKQLAKIARENRGLEKELQKLESKISLLIANRTSIQEIDRNLKKKLKKAAGQKVPVKEVFVNDKKKMEGYANLFYLLQTEPKYLAKLAFLVQSEKIAPFMETMLGTLYGDVFSPREEYLILELFKQCISTEIHNVKNPSEFTQSSSVIATMIVTYNKRRQGVEYLKTTYSTLIKNVISMDDVLSELDPKVVASKLDPQMIGNNNTAGSSPKPTDKKKGDKIN